MLLDIGRVEVNLKDGDGWTLVSTASSNGHKSAVKLLLNTSISSLSLDDKDT
jgi:ankyrin repeat protein